MPNTKKKEITVTSLEDLKSYASGALVKLPDFAEGMPFVAKLKRPSMLALVKGGKIPNSLMESANALFSGDISVNTKKGQSLDSIFEILDIICESAFVSPTWEELKSSGIELTDEQLIAVFNYTQNGIRALESFRSE